MSTIAIYPSAIPPELKERPQWVVWQLETRQGRPTKVPYDVNGKYARVDDPTTWATFDEAIQDGRPIGYVFSADDPFTGIDLDKCRDPATGQATSWACDIIRALDSYTELSPSGTGVHVIVKAQLAGPHHRKDGVEIYDRKRFFTITGAKVKGTPAMIEDRQREVDALTARVWPDVERTTPPATWGPIGDDELLRRALAARNWEKFTKAWWGDTAPWNHDASRADMALAAMLAFWTTDGEQIARLMQRSALYRPEKWDARHYGNGDTYLEHLVQRALDFRATA
jgi:putative DNA primase/helicase